MTMSKSYIDAIIQPFNKDRSNGETEDRVRHGKTSRDKAKGHVAYKKNRRIWDDGGKGSGGQWIKV